MQIRKDFSLKKFNTFGLTARAAQFAPVFSVQELQQVLRENGQPVHILGGGSNILLTGDLAGLTIKNEIDGIAISEVTSNQTVIEVGGGVEWHSLVLWAIGNDLGGIENLSLIPGSVGAAPIQNIGAYGVELRDVFHSLEAVEMATGKVHTFDAAECQFGYRDSFFKREGKGCFFITKVRLRLTVTDHGLNLSYGAIQQTLEEMQVKKPTVRDVSNAVIAIRRGKLPDPKEIGNSGSFFKNPEVEKADFQRLKAAFPNIVHFDLPDGKVKIPAGWLIEQAGWKGRRFGDAGCHAKQALVLVNYGGATGQEILELAHRIQDSVEEKFGIRLTPEVNIW